MIALLKTSCSWRIKRCCCFWEPGVNTSALPVEAVLVQLGFLGSGFCPQASLLDWPSLAGACTRRVSCCLGEAQEAWVLMTATTWKIPYVVQRTPCLLLDVVAKENKGKAQTFFEEDLAPEHHGSLGQSFPSSGQGNNLGYKMGQNKPRTSNEQRIVLGLFPGHRP